MSRKCARSRFGAAACLALVASIVWDGRDNSQPRRSTNNALAAPVDADPHHGFSVRKTGQGWSLVSPQNRPFFSIGVSVVDQGAVREGYDAAKPSYSAWQHYDSSDAWAEAVAERLSSWRFTTIGGWSDFPALRKTRAPSLLFMPVLHLGSTVGAPWLDMWDHRNLARMERLAVDRIDPLRDDPRVVGYYSDNEIGWWNATLWKMTLEHPATSGQRQRLIQLLKEIYRSDWDALVADFVPHGAANWQELRAGGVLAYRPGGDGIRTMRRFLALMADRYYQLMHDMIRRHDPNALYLGDRYQSFYYPEVVRASAQYIDVASTNLNASWNDGHFIRSLLGTLHELTEKPILVSEFYSAAMENRSGNKNATSGFLVVETQHERAAAARNTLHRLASLPYVVGAEWFQYYDEPPHGRADGEDYNFGLVDIQDAPYAELTAAFSEFNAEEFAPARSQPRLDARAGVPRAPSNPSANLRFMTALKHWDRERGFVPATTAAPLGDLYMAWSADALYLGLYAWDIVERVCYPGGAMPDADRAVWTVELDGGTPIVVRLGGGRPAEVSDPRVHVEGISGFDHDVRLIAVMRVPVERLGKQAVKPGDGVTLRSNLVTHGRAYEFGWGGKFVLAD